jgi:hypothetical protein
VCGLLMITREKEQRSADRHKGITISSTSKNGIASKMNGRGSCKHIALLSGITRAYRQRPCHSAAFQATFPLYTRTTTSAATDLTTSTSRESECAAKSSYCNFCSFDNFLYGLVLVVGTEQR